MKNKFIIIVFFSLLFAACSEFPAEKERTQIYSRERWTNNYELFTNRYIGYPYDQNDFIDSQFISNVKIEKYGGYEQKTFKNGLLKTYKDVYDSELNYEYFYDSDLKIVKQIYTVNSTSKITEYKYIEPYTREIYEDSKLLMTESVEFFKDGYNTHYEQGKVLKDQRFVFENKKLKSVVETSSGYGSYVCHNLFEYDKNGILKKQTEYYEPDDLRSILEVTKVVDGVIEEYLTTTYKNGSIENEYKTILSEFDGHKNWHKRDIYKNGILENTILRKIDYVNEN